MKIDNYIVGPHFFKTEGGKKILLVDCRDCIFNSSLADDGRCRLHIFLLLQRYDADLVVLSDVYERVYDEEQTKLLKELAAVFLTFDSKKPWLPKYLGDGTPKCEKEYAARHNFLLDLIKNKYAKDPVVAYYYLIKEIERNLKKLQVLDEEGKKCLNPYLSTLAWVKEQMEKTTIIKKIKDYITNLKALPNTTQLYSSFFKAQIKPSFIGARLISGKEEELELLDEYSVGNTTIQIFKHPNKVEPIYFVNPPEYNLPPEKYFVLSKTKEIVSKHRPERGFTVVGRSKEYFNKIYQTVIKDVAQHYNISLGDEDIEELAEIVTRYTVGYGILEILFHDRRITDIYIDSPLGTKPIYLVHSKYGQCQTNIIYTQEEAEAFVTKLRSMSGRPFDEAHPVLDFDLPDVETRVAAISRPLAPDGLAFAFRLHKSTPWTLPQFIDVKYLTPLAAGMLSFFINMQSTMLIAGSRGAGKTSLLTSLILEIPQNLRIIVQEDTLEIPVPYMKRIGFNIQRLKTQSAISVSKSSSEVPPEEALRTALRLGDSCIVLGEVRSVEARVLYEAMRVGAAGNVVMGTIHGDSAYSVWDRVVNDLEVPSTSFKATDLVVVARPIRIGGSLKRKRRVYQITEIKKHWLHDPEAEGGLLDLMIYNSKKDELELLEDNLKDSDLFNKISAISGMNLNRIWEDIKANAEIKSYMVDIKNQINEPDLLEAANTVPAYAKYLLFKEKNIEEHGKPDYKEIVDEWKKWYKEEFVKRIIAKKHTGF